MEKAKKYAFGLIDAQRGFMPPEEGERLGLPGFGELPIKHGERIVPNVNRLLAVHSLARCFTFLTRDWHPNETAHFSATPNYSTTWPVHCVGGTPGAELHPNIQVPISTKWLEKGMTPLKRGEDDTSYSGYNAINDLDGIRLGEYLDNRRITTVALGGLALDYCVKATALDLRQKAGLEVVVITDATEEVAQETGLEAIDELEKAGVTFATTDEWLHQVLMNVA